MPGLLKKGRRTGWQQKEMYEKDSLLFFFSFNIDGFKPKFYKLLFMVKSAKMYICATSSTL